MATFPRELHGTIAPTDDDWYEFLRGKGSLPEVNFWTPSTTHPVRAPEFSPFLFKLKKPHNAICGFGFFARWAAPPDWMAWDCFEQANGCPDLAALRNRLGKLRAGIQFRGKSVEIGCIAVVQPKFFAEADWVPQPADWPKTSVRATKYDLASPEGVRVWNACLERANVLPVERVEAGVIPIAAEPSARYGAPRLVEPRLGQGAFRVAVTEEIPWLSDSRHEDSEEAGSRPWEANLSRAFTCTGFGSRSITTRG